MPKQLGKRETQKILASCNIDVSAVANYQTQIGKIDNSIIEINEQIEVLKTKIKKLNKRKIQIGKNLLQTDVIWKLYYKTGVTATDICELFGIRNANTLREIIDGYTYTTKCRLCKKTLEYYLTCKTNLNELDSREHLCSECSDSLIKKRKEEAKIFPEQQKQFGIRLQELKAMDYLDYLQTPEWDATRKKMLRRASYKCQLCNQQGTLNVHHKTYERLGEEQFDDLIVLCKDCHAKFHDKIGGK